MMFPLWMNGLEKGYALPKLIWKGCLQISFYRFPLSEKGNQTSEEGAEASRL